MAPVGETDAWVERLQDAIQQISKLLRGVDRTTWAFGDQQGSAGHTSGTRHSGGWRQTTPHPLMYDRPTHLPRGYQPISITLNCNSKLRSPDEFSTIGKGKSTSPTQQEVKPGTRQPNAVASPLNPRGIPGAQQILQALKSFLFTIQRPGWAACSLCLSQRSKWRTRLDRSRPACRSQSKWEVK